MSVVSSQIPSSEAIAIEAAEQACFHCGEPVPAGVNITVALEGQDQPMCCAGCAAVAETIVNLGMTGYYRQRTNTAEKPQDLVPDEVQAASRALLRERPDMVSTQLEADQFETGLLIRGMTCPACAWLCENRLQQLAGVLEADVNYSTQRAKVIWDQNHTNIDEILESLARIGYQPAFYDPLVEQSAFEQEKKQQLKQIGLAAVLGMQVMMLSIALYFGEDGAMETSFLTSFRWIALLLTTPVLFISAAGILKSGLRELRLLRPGMDLAISLGLSIAYVASIYSTLSGHGEIYCDTIVMFVLFILGGRYIEFTLRKKSLDQTNTSERSLPLAAVRVDQHAGTEDFTVIPALDLALDDHILIKGGEIIPADCEVISGETLVNESLLTGEAKPITKTVGDTLVAGSINTGSTITARVIRVGNDTTLAVIDRMIEKARSKKPRLTSLSNQTASIFISAVILIAMMTIAYHGVARVDIWLDRVIAILIVCCPCALSLAMPTVYTAIIGRMSREGIIFKDLDRLFHVLRLDHFIFDKTGTCTEGQFTILKVKNYSEKSEHELLTLCAALEQYSEHPIAQAFSAINGKHHNVTNYEASAGKGIRANIDGVSYSLGNRNYIIECLGNELDQVESESTNTRVYLADADVLLAEIELGDKIKPELQRVVQQLQAQGIDCDLCSGDALMTTKALAQAIGFNDFRAECLPEEKLAYVNFLQNRQQKVAMIGDGVNDAPSLSQSDISFAIGKGADIAQLQADAIFMKPDLNNITKSFAVAKFSRKIIQQNIAWAVSYNLLALPIAVSGLLAPWMAAIGMSLSSLIVVANADRVRRMTFK